MFIVVDWNYTEFFGPFQTKDEAEDWLASKGIHIGEYDNQEVSINTVQPTTATLKDIKAA